MSKTVRLAIVIVIGAIIVAVPALMFRGQHARARAALAAYKAELRARGEKLSVEELGYPRPPAASSNLALLIAGVNRLPPAAFDPGSLELMHFVGPARADVAWTQPQLRFGAWSVGKSNAVTWEMFAAQFEKAAAALQDLRAAARFPPPYFFNDLSNFTNQFKAPFVEQRKAAQWLMGDAMAALHGGESERMRGDVHALARLAQFHREDPTLVNQMIRTAIAGLGLALTWEALQAPGWREEALAALQQDWDAANLADGFELGMLGERAWGEAVLAHLRALSPRERVAFLKFSNNSGGNAPPPRSGEDYLAQFVLMPLWAANAEADELLFLQHNQAALDAFRSLRQGTPMVEVNRRLGANVAQLEAEIANPLKRYRHLFTAIALPNYIRAASTCTRHETQRRLTITAIALERYRLRNEKLPSEIESLVPHFLAAVPIDPMSAKPLRYRLNAEGSFTLYSVGEDGRDDGGDPNPPAARKQFGLWEGKDAVWPAAAK